MYWWLWILNVFFSFDCLTILLYVFEFFAKILIVLATSTWWEVWPSIQELESEPGVSQKFYVQWSSLSYQRQWLVSAFPVMALSPWSSATAGGAKVGSQTGWVVCWDGPAMPSNLKSSWSTASLSFNNVCLNPIQLQSWVLAVFLPSYPLSFALVGCCAEARGPERIPRDGQGVYSLGYGKLANALAISFVSSALLLDVNKHLWRLFTCKVLDFTAFL